MASLSTNPSYHVDLLQLLASYLLGTEKEFRHLNGFVFGILVEAELPRVFCGGSEAHDFLQRFAVHEALQNDLAVNPLFGRADLAPRIIETGERQGGHHFEVQLGFKREGQVLRDRDDLHYAWLKSPPYIYHAVRMGLMRILEFQSFVATRAAFPDRNEKRIGNDIRDLGSKSIVTLSSQRGVPVQVTLWNYDLAAANPARLMLPVHAAWFLKAAEAGAAIAEGREVPKPAHGGWDIDSDAFLEAIGASPSDHILSIGRAAVDESPLISVLLRKGSRVYGGASRDGDLAVDRFYQSILPRDWRARSALYGPVAAGARTLVARETRIPTATARNFDELLAAVESVRPASSEGRLLFRGQTAHFTLPRSAEERVSLYGDAAAEELSLTTSASREPDAAYDAFHGRFQLYLQGLLYASVPSAAFQPHDDDIRRMSVPFEDGWIRQTYRKWVHWYGESIWDLVAMGLAQHYGFPTHGLDLTEDLDTAAWFALNRFTRYESEGAQRVWYEPLRDDAWQESAPVIYVVEVDGRVRRNLESAMSELPLPNPLRVLRQSAYLHYGGWGLQTNACAEDVRLAIFLGPRFEPRERKTVDHYFPSRRDDPFYERMLLLQTVAMTGPDMAPFGRVLEFENPLDGELYRAVMFERFDEVPPLLGRGAGVDHRDASRNTNFGLTALHWAAFHGRDALVNDFLARGAEIDASDIGGRTPLVCAALRGEATTVRLLLDRGASFEALAYPGWQMIPPPMRSPAVMKVLRAAGYRG